MGSVPATVKHFFSPEPALPKLNGVKALVTIGQLINRKKTINEKLLRVVDSQFLIQSNGFQTRLNLMKVNNF